MSARPLVKLAVAAVAAAALVLPLAAAQATPNFPLTRVAQDRIVDGAGLHHSAQQAFVATAGRLEDDRRDLPARPHLQRRRVRRRGRVQRQRGQVLEGRARARERRHRRLPLARRRPDRRLRRAARQVADLEPRARRRRQRRRHLRQQLGERQLVVGAGHGCTRPERATHPPRRRSRATTREQPGLRHLLHRLHEHGLDAGEPARRDPLDRRRRDVVGAGRHGRRLGRHRSIALVQPPAPGARRHDCGRLVVAYANGTTGVDSIASTDCGVTSRRARGRDPTLAAHAHGGAGPAQPRSCRPSRWTRRARSTSPSRPGASGSRRRRSRPRPTRATRTSRSRA